MSEQGPERSHEAIIGKLREKLQTLTQEDFPFVAPDFSRVIAEEGITNADVRLLSVGQFNAALSRLTGHNVDSLSYTQRGELLSSWMEDNGVAFYAAEKAEFSEKEAVRAAVEAGAEYVIVENLS